VRLANNIKMSSPFGLGGRVSRKTFLILVLLLDAAVIMFIYSQMKAAPPASANGPVDVLASGNGPGDGPKASNPTAGASAVNLPPQGGAAEAIRSGNRTVAGGGAALSGGPGDGLKSGDFTIIVLPDTQYYSGSRQAIFTNQTRWIVSQKAALNIVFAVHEGDITDNGGLVELWRDANASMSVLDGVVPYSVVEGNHDRGAGLFEAFFPTTRYEGNRWYGGGFKGNMNSYQYFSAGGSDYMVLNLDFCPEADAVAWANQVAGNHTGRSIILVTHGFIDPAGSRSVFQCSGTQYIWDGLIAGNPNIFLLLCGHMAGEGRRADTVGGRVVHQLLADYQSRENGGNGWLRILVFHPSEGRINIYTYSPYLGRFETDADSQFALDWKP
jgi:hypothetical protein